jgi:NOL1/NOP2/fmu family ribosome biogenesis protein
LKANRNKGIVKAGKEEVKKILSLARFPEDHIVRIGDAVVALPGTPDDLQPLFQSLRILKAGTKIFTVRNKDFLPSHVLALSTELKEKAFPAAELDHKQATEYLRRGNPAIPDVSTGWFLVRYKGINLGFANNIGTRVNNYYPVEWRIRMSVPLISKEPVNWEQSNLAGSMKIPQNEHFRYLQNLSGQRNLRCYYTL